MNKRGIMAYSHFSQHGARLLCLVLILLLGWTLRTHDLDKRSLWEDEGWTMLLSKGPGVDDVTETLVDDQHPPLFFLLFRGWRNLTGESEFATRYFSVLISMIAVALIAQLGRELFTPTAGLLAALLLALADNHIDLAQEVRHYSQLATFVILSSLCYVRWWRHPTRTNRIGYVLASIALLYTHYLGGYVLIAQVIHALLTVRPRRRLFEAMFLFGAICLGFLPWLPVVLIQNSVRWKSSTTKTHCPKPHHLSYGAHDAAGKRFAFAAHPHPARRDHHYLYARHPTPNEFSYPAAIWPVLFLVI
jgi:uncharacterized membrane protein